MSKNKKVATKKNTKPTAPLGRKRDQSLDGQILEATIQVLADEGFDAMTMDRVALKAKTGKASMYRRWPSKAELVRDALIWMSTHSVELDPLPDTGKLRDDLLALQKDYSAEFSERKIRVLSKLGSFFSEHESAAKEATSGIFDPFIKVQQVLMKRAITRGEIPKTANTELASHVIVSMISYRNNVQKKPFDKNFYASFLDQIIIPALKNKMNVQ